MNYSKILKRAWDILWSYKTLWIFGMIMALSTASGYPGDGRGSSRSGNARQFFSFTIPSELQAEIGRLYQLLIQLALPKNLSIVITIGIVTLLFLIAVCIILTAAHYVSRTALIKMVDSYETSGEKATWRQGFRIGWSRHAWQLFLIDLMIYLPIIVIAIVLFSCALLPMVISLILRHQPTVPGIVASVGLSFLIIFILVIIGFFLSLFMEIIYRECVLKENGIKESIRGGWRKVTQNIKGVFLMWLILIGIRVGYFLVTIPVVILLLGVGLLIGGGIAVAVYFIVKMVSILAGWIMAIIVGGSLFLILISLPLLFLKGLLETYISSAWTLTYRELNGFGLAQNTLPSSAEGDQAIGKEGVPTPL